MLFNKKRENAVGNYVQCMNFRLTFRSLKYIHCFSVFWGENSASYVLIRCEVYKYALQIHRVDVETSQSGSVLKLHTTHLGPA